VTGQRPAITNPAPIGTTCVFRNRHAHSEPFSLVSTEHIAPHERRRCRAGYPYGRDAGDSPFRPTDEAQLRRQNEGLECRVFRVRACSETSHRYVLKSHKSKKPDFEIRLFNVPTGRKKFPTCHARRSTQRSPARALCRLPCAFGARAEAVWFISRKIQ
jgi:hypothetical protein